MKRKTISELIIAELTTDKLLEVIYNEFIDIKIKRLYLGVDYEDFCITYGPCYKENDMDMWRFVKCSSLREGFEEIAKLIIDNKL